MLRIVGDCNFADGFYDMGFGTGTSIKKDILEKDIKLK